MLLKTYTDSQLRGGVGLSHVRTRYEVQVAGKIVGYSDDPSWGLAYARECKERGIEAGLYTILVARSLYVQPKGD